VKAMAIDSILSILKIFWSGLVFVRMYKFCSVLIFKLVFISLSVLRRRCVLKTGFQPRFLFDIRIPIARVRVFGNFAALNLGWFRVRFVCPYRSASFPP